MNTFEKLLNPTHHTLGTIAMIVFALIWLLDVRAEAAEPAISDSAALEPVVVRASYPTDAVLAPVVVTGSERASRLVLAPVFMSIGEESADHSGTEPRSARSSGLIALIRCWFIGL